MTVRAGKKRRNPYKKLIGYMRDNDIKQSELAQLLNKGTSAVNQNLNGTGGDFTVSEAIKICKEYGLSADDIFF